MKEDYDLIIIGAGSAGITAARFASRLGLSVALVERSRIGGDCTWTGCVPSKSLLKAASVAHQMRSADRYGLAPSAPPVDLGLVMARVKSAMQEIYEAESPAVLQAEGIDVVMGEARFLDHRTIQMQSPSSRDLTARRYLIATGAKPLVPPGQSGGTWLGRGPRCPWTNRDLSRPKPADNSEAHLRRWGLRRRFPIYALRWLSRFYGRPKRVLASKRSWSVGTRALGDVHRP